MSSYNEAALAAHEREVDDAATYAERVEAKAHDLLSRDDWCDTFGSDLAGNEKFTRESYRLLRTDPCEYGRFVFAAMLEVAMGYAPDELDREDRDRDPD